MKRDVNNYIDLNGLAGGALVEKIGKAIEDVARNILDPNTDPKAKREITVKIKFAPNKNRSTSDTSIIVTTKLAPTEAIDTQLTMGIDLSTGALQVVEWGQEIPGQMSLWDYQADGREQGNTDGPEADPENGEITENVRKPIDLRARVREREELKA